MLTDRKTWTGAGIPPAHCDAVGRKIADPAIPERRGTNDGVSGHMAAAATLPTARSTRSVLPETPPPAQSRGLTENAVWLSADAAHLKDD